MIRKKRDSIILKLHQSDKDMVELWRDYGKHGACLHGVVQKEFFDCVLSDESWAALEDDYKIEIWLSDQPTWRYVDEN